jgi:hypothetical protein
MSKLLETFIQTVARKLGETDPTPIGQIRRIVERLGPEQTALLVKDAIAIQANGGLWTLHCDRKRTTGGIFFVIVRGYLSKADRRYVFPQRYMAKAASDELAASTRSKTGATTGTDKPIVAPKLNAVNMAARERHYNAPQAQHP